MTEGGGVFLGRRSYAERRRADAARLLPVFGLFLILLPVLFGPGASLAGTLIYVFGTWTALLAAAAFLSRRLGRGGPPEG